MEIQNVLVALALALAAGSMGIGPCAPRYPRRCPVFDPPGLTARSDPPVVPPGPLGVSPDPLAVPSGPAGVSWVPRPPCAPRSLCPLVSLVIPPRVLLCPCSIVIV
jgi:hypothetical protein